MYMGCLHICACVCVYEEEQYCRGQRPIRVLDAAQRVNRGGYGSRTGCPPPPLAAHPWCCGATEDWAPRVRYLPPLPPLRSHGLVSGSQNALWALGRLPTSVRPPPPRHPPPRLGGGQGAHTPPIPKSVRCCTPPAAGTSRGCPSWCRGQQCCTHLCPRHNLHAGTRAHCTGST